MNLTGVIQPKGVTISPNNRGAGPFLITVSNQTDDAHTVTLEGDSVEETVGPIQPQDTATIQRTLKPGTYEVRAGSERAVVKEIPPFELKVGKPRKSSADELLLPYGRGARPAASLGRMARSTRRDLRAGGHAPRLVDAPS